MSFPYERPRRLRRSERLRRWCARRRLSPDDFIYPLFVVPGDGVRHEIASMPGNYHLSVDELGARGRGGRELGIPGVILFGLPASQGRASARRPTPTTASCSRPSRAIRKTPAASCW